MPTPQQRRTVLSGRHLFVPSEIPDLALWLEADRSPLWQDSARTTKASADGDPVGAWDDLSGNARHAVQATGSKRPVLKLSIVNGKPVLRFTTASSHHLATAAFGAALEQPNTVFVVASITGPTGINHFLIDGVSGRHAIWQSSASPFAMQFFAGSIVASSTQAPSGFHVYTFLVNSLSSQFYTDGTLTGSGSVGTQSLARLTVGINTDLASGPLGGDIACVLVYRRMLSPAEISRVWGYLS